MAPIGILAALHDEIAELLTRLGPGAQRHTIGMRNYYVGELSGRACVIVLARMGKVAAAATAVTLIREFGVRNVVFTGLAGGIAPSVRVGDVVIAEALVQHDMDAQPLFPRFEVPLLGRSRFPTDEGLNAVLAQCATDFLSLDLPRVLDADTRERYGVVAPALHRGEIASGDQFIGSAEVARHLAADLPTALCVEMEGAAVAQVCHEYDVPCAVLRTISDRADAAALVDFEAFLREIASVYSAGILGRFMAQA